MISILKIKFISVSQYLFIEHRSSLISVTIYMGWEEGDRIGTSLFL